MIDAGSDMQVAARAFAFGTLDFDPDLSAPAFTLAGKSGETWELDSSANLQNWLPVQTNSFSSDALASVLLSNTAANVFIKAVRK